MQNITEDGDYIPEKELNTSFRIPKRKASELYDTSSSEQSVQQSILANTYFHPTQDAGGSGQWQASPVVYDALPISQAIYNSLTNNREVPKNFKKDIFKETVPDVDDQTLPKELIAQFQPLFCKLCNMHLNGQLMAKMHYKSKNHEKKIRRFLFEYSVKTKTPLHKRARVTNTPKAAKEEDDPRYFHCVVCDIALTGKIHAESHYMGRNHQKVLMGNKAPAGGGHYTVDGTWIRNQKVKGDNFGLDFRLTPDPNLIAPNGQTKFQCEICKVVATCQEQLDMHLNGQKHLKKMKQFGLEVLAAPGTSNNVSKVAGSLKADDAFAPYRTPSGQYYCQICDLTLNSEMQFTSHLTSKNHSKNVKQK